jgi:NADPH:quinone reductase-like Zn-dependent oxidoreductase
MPVPQENEIQARVRATSVNFGDLIARDFAHTTPGTFNMPFLFWLPARVSFGLRTPRVKILGSEFAGEVAATGRNARRF